MGRLATHGLFGLLSEIGKDVYLLLVFEVLSETGFSMDLLLVALRQSSRSWYLGGISQIRLWCVSYILVAPLGGQAYLESHCIYLLEGALHVGVSPHSDCAIFQLKDLTRWEERRMVIRLGTIRLCLDF